MVITSRGARACGFEGNILLILLIEAILRPQDVASLATALGAAAFEDGAETAGFAARTVKQNRQAAADPSIDMWCEQLAGVLAQHAVFDLAARPKRIIGPMFTRYRTGDQYGTHVDEAILDGARSDLSFTLFLSPPEQYDGGELVIDSAAGEDGFKLPAGSLVLYPATTLHHVAPVTRGERLAAVGWVRSYVRDDAQRALLFDLDTAKRRLFDIHGKSPEFDLFNKCSANLMRMWCDD
jgi:PKHD-type hydroxylase